MDAPFRATHQTKRMLYEMMLCAEHRGAFTWAMWSSSCVNSFSGWLMTHSSCEKDSHSRSRKHASSDSQLQEKV